jgi:hypothetical protein
MSSVEPPPDPRPDRSFTAARTRGERLRRLRGRELVRAAQSLLYLPAAAFALDRWGLQKVQERLVRRAPAGSGPVPAGPASFDEARRLAWVVDGTARRGLWKANCLQRSLVLWWFLLRRGIGSEIRIGVRRRPGAAPGARELDFHAWVECQGLVLNDRADIREHFATFERAIAPHDAHWR